MRLPRVKELAAEQVADLHGAVAAPAVARVLMPEQQAEHGMIMPPDIPSPVQPLVLRKRPEIAVLGLKLHQVGHESGQVVLQLRIVRQPQYLSRAA